MKKTQLYVIIFILLALPSMSFADVDTWTKKADMPTPRRALSTCVVNGKIYVIGGWDGDNYLSTVEEYDPATDTWTKKADMPTPRGTLCASAVNGKIYALEAVTPPTPQGVFDVRVINPDTQEAVKPQGFISVGELVYNFPNPFRAEQGTTFRYVTTEKVESIKVQIFNLAGVPVGVVSRTGSNEVRWYDPLVHAGLYVYRMDVTLEGGGVRKFKRALEVYK